jgi:hypothetical protein
MEMNDVLLGTLIALGFTLFPGRMIRNLIKPEVGTPELASDILPVWKIGP